MSIIDALLADAPAFAFVNAVRILAGAVPDAAPLGGTGPAAREALRLRPLLSLAFPTSEVAAIERQRRADGGERFRLTVTMPGLYGPASPLPTSFSERLLAEDGDGPMRGLCDLLHHRLLSLLYRILIKHRPGLGGDRGAAAIDHERRLRRLLGIPDELPGGIPGGHLLACAGLLAMPTRNADALERLLGGWFATGCVIEACIVRWTPLAADTRTRLGHGACRLGLDMVVGERVRSRATAYRVTLGPVPWDVADDFSPDGARHAELLALVQFFDPQQLDAFIELVVDTTGLPPLALGDPRCRLGRAAHGAGQRGRFAIRTLRTP